MTQLSLDRMPTRLFACTPSRLSAWLACPRRYRMTYLDRPQPPKGPPWAHNSVGASAHNALAGWWRRPVEQRSPRLAGELVVDGWLDDGFRDDAQAAAWRDRTSGMVTAYAEGLDPADEPVGVERTVSTVTERLALSGRIDRLDRRGDELAVVDYKTGRYVPSDDDARTSLALAVYAVAAARTMRRPCHRVELHHLPTGTVARHDHTDESLRRHIARAESIAADAVAAEAAYRSGDASDEDFPANPGPMCGWCDFRRHCPAGRAAAPDRRSWEALDEVGC